MVVYKIECIPSRRVYIGSSIDFETRKKQHYYNLNKGKHPNRYLQNSFNKYGGGEFVYSIIGEGYVDRSAMLEAEKRWIEKYNSCNKRLGFNIVKDPTTGGITELVLVFNKNTLELIDTCESAIEASLKYSVKHQRVCNVCSTYNPNKILKRKLYSKNGYIFVKKKVYEDNPDCLKITLKSKNKVGSWNHKIILKIDKSTNEVLGEYSGIKSAIASTDIKVSKSSINKVSECVRGIRMHYKGYVWVDKNKHIIKSSQLMLL